MDDSPSFRLPRNLLFVADQLSNFSRNRFRIESTSADTGTAGRIITMNMPTSALLDMKSFRFHYDIDAGATGGSTSTRVSGLIPESADAIIQSLEVYVNGIQVQQATQEYNFLSHALRLGGYNQDSQQSKGRLVNHSQIYGGTINEEQFDASMGDQSGEKASLVVDSWTGFLNQLSTRYLPTDLIGQITVRITLAPNGVLSGATDVSGATDITVAGVTPPSYTLSNMYFTIDSIVVGEAYNSLLRNQLASSALPLNYKEYYAFTLPNQTGTSFTNRFNLSSGSIDKLYALNRASDYATFGVAVDLVDVSANLTSPLTALGNQLVSKYFASNSFKAAGERDSEDGTLRYNFNINNVQFPQYDATNSMAMADVAYTQDKVGLDPLGILITSPTAFCRGQAIYTLQLNHAGMGLSTQSGYNSRGINSTLSFTMKNIANTAKDNTVFVETTAQMRIASGKSLAVSF